MDVHLKHQMSPSPSLQDTTSLDGENSFAVSLDTYGSTFGMLSGDSNNTERIRSIDNNPDVRYNRNNDASLGRNDMRNNIRKRVKDTNSSSSRGTRGYKREKELQLKQLRQYYELANERALKIASSINVDVVDGAMSEAQRNSANTYSALSALLYATISVAKIDALEMYVKRRGTQLPSKLFDMSEWEPILNRAKSFRNSELMSISQSEMKDSPLDANPNKSKVSDNQRETNGKDIVSLGRAEMVETMNKERTLALQEISHLQSSLSSLSSSYNVLREENSKLREELDMMRLPVDHALQSNKSSAAHPLPNPSTSSNYERTITQLRKVLVEKTEELRKKDVLIDSKDVVIKELRNNLDEAKKLEPSCSSNPETLDVVSQQAVSLVSSSIRSSVAKVTANEVESKLCDTRENIFNDLVKELQGTRNQLDEMRNQMREVSKSSIPHGSKCTLTYLPNNQSDQQCKIAIKTRLKPSVRTEIVVDAEQFKEAYSIGRDNDYVLRLESEQQPQANEQYNNNFTLIQLKKENAELRRKLDFPRNSVVPSLRSPEEKLKVAITVQRVVRGFLGRARYARILFERQGNPDNLLACSGTRQGQTGWYFKKEDSSYYYFCKSEHYFLSLCGPLSEEDYISAKNDAMGQKKRYKNMVKVDLSAVFGCKTQFEKSNTVTARRHSKGKQEIQSQSVKFPATAVINDLDKKVDELTRDLKVEKKAVRRRSSSSHGSGKLSPRMRNKQIVLIQTHVRMLLAKLKAGRIRCSLMGHLETDYVPMPYTKRGASGWYMKSSKCYYMASKRKHRSSNKENQLVKVLGPIEESEHSRLMQKYRKMSIGYERMVLDYSCVLGLESTVQDANEKLEIIQNEKQKMSISGPSPEIQAQLKSYVSEIRKLRHQLKLNEEMDNFLSKIQSSSQNVEKVVMVQSLIRSFLAKCRVSTKKLVKLASEQGILVATVRDQQGKDGWYVAPDGSFYYFVLNSGEWNLVAGPVPPDKYSSMITKNRVIHVKSSEVGGRNHLIPLSPEISSGTKAAYDVQNLDRKLYINTGTNDIFVGAPVVTTFLSNHDKTRHCPVCSVGSSVNAATEREKIESYLTEPSKPWANGKFNTVSEGGGAVQRRRRSSNMMLPPI